MLASLALLLQLAAPAPDTTWGAVRGSVQSEPSGLPVPLAVVELHTPERIIATTADSLGGYVLRRVPAGRQMLRVRHLGHGTTELEVLVPPGGTLPLDVILRQQPLAIDTVQATGAGYAGAVDSVAAPRPEVVGLVDVHALESGGGVASAGLGGDGAGRPGGEPADPQDVLYVRGSAADLKLVLLDGAPVYAPFHSGGLIESFEPGVLHSARLHLGGAPARYDGGLSYVMDLTTRSPNGEHLGGAAGVDMMSARGMLEGPLGRGATFLASGRLVHGASMRQLEGEPFPYRYGDALGRVDVALGRGRLSATGFSNQEGVRVDTIPGREEFARWGNLAGSLRYRGRLGGADAEVTAALGDFNAFLPRGTLLKSANLRRARLAVDLASTEGAVRLRYGWSYDRTWVHHNVRDRSNGERTLLDAVSTGDVGGAYLDATWQAASRVVLRGGMRGDMFSDGPFISFAPRIAATWLLTDRAALTLAGGRYHQYVRVKPEFPFQLPIPNIADSLGIATELRVASANHLSLSLDQQLDEGTRLGLEGFFKRYEGLPVPDEIGAYTSGVDVWVRRSAGAVDGWAGYSLSWSWSQGTAPRDTARFTGRQILSAGVGGRVGRHGRFGLRVAYGAGLPYTGIGLSQGTGPPPHDGAPAPGNSSGGTSSPEDGEFPSDDAPLDAFEPDPFLRLDAEVSGTWSPRFAGRVTQITPYVRVMNALDRRDALFYRYNPGEDDNPRGVATLPVLPVVGVEWKF